MISLILNKIIPANKVGIDWLVGDIHGYKEKLFEKLNQVGFDFDNDRLFSTGDIFDRGPQSFEMALVARNESWFYSVVGNHELIYMVEYFEPNKYNSRTDKRIGAQWKYELDANDLKLIANAIQAKFALSITLHTRYGAIGIVHATPPEDWNELYENELMSLNNPVHTKILSDRKTFKNALSAKQQYCTNIDLVVCGHNTHEKVLKTGNILIIDTHDSFNGEGELTILNINECYQQLQK